MAARYLWCELGPADAPEMRAGRDGGAYEATREAQSRARGNAGKAIGYAAHAWPSFEGGYEVVGESYGLGI